MHFSLYAFTKSQKMHKHKCYFLKTILAYFSSYQCLSFIGIDTAWSYLTDVEKQKHMRLIDELVSSIVQIKLHPHIKFQIALSR